LSSCVEVVEACQSAPHHSHLLRRWRILYYGEFVPRSIYGSAETFNIRRRKQREITTNDTSNVLHNTCGYRGPSIYDVHTEGKGSGSSGRMWTGGQALCGRPHRNLKLESTDVVLSSSHAKKLASFITRISSLDGIKSGNFSAI